MEIELIRINIKACTTDGELFIGNRKICATTESTLNRLPVGKYTIHKAEARKFFSPLNGVKKKGDRFIHVGTHLVPGVVINTRNIFNALLERIRKSIERNHEVTLVIKE